MDFAHVVQQSKVLVKNRLGIVPFFKIFLTDKDNNVSFMMAGFIFPLLDIINATAPAT
jgi:hypothetical protein